MTALDLLQQLHALGVLLTPLPMGRCATCPQRRADPGPGGRDTPAQPGLHALVAEW